MRTAASFVLRVLLCLANPFPAVISPAPAQETSPESVIVSAWSAEELYFCTPPWCFFRDQGKTGGTTPIEANTAPWFRDFARHDPRPAPRQVDVPILALFGERDLLVPPQQNAAPMRAALADSPSDRVSVHALETNPLDATGEDRTA